MSRMIEALKRIEAKSLAEQPAAEPVAPKTTTEIAAEEAASKPIAPVSIESAVESTFEELDRAMSLICDEQSDSTDGLADEAPSWPPLSEEACELLPMVEEEPSPSSEAASAPQPSIVEMPSPTKQMPESCERPYGELAGQILAQLKPGSPSVVMFTSPDDGVGKTAMLANVTPILARRLQGEVILVDAHGHDPRSLTEPLGVIDMGAGLPEVLRGQCAWPSAVRATAIPRLSLLPGGQPSFPGESSDPRHVDTGALLRELVRAYTLVVVDAPSLAQPGIAAMTSCCEGTYLVVRLGESSKRVVRASARLIQQCRGVLLGCIAIE